MRLYERERAIVASFYDEPTGSFQYVLVDKATRAAAIIDPVLDFDERAGATYTRNADAIADYVEREGLNVAWVLDTHPHADHLSAASYLGQKLDAPRAIGRKIIEVQKLWRVLYGLPDFPADGRQWDRLLDPDDTVKVGELTGRVLLSPGHTLASISYVFDDLAFVHDTLMVPDSGTSRADFPGGDPHALWRSIREILDLPCPTSLFVGHDYGKHGREPYGVTTVAETRAENIHVRDGISRAEFVHIREERDATLPLPKLMLAALQVNIRGGRLPEPDLDGNSYLRIPLNRFKFDDGSE